MRLKILMGRKFSQSFYCVFSQRCSESLANSAARSLKIVALASVLADIL